MATTVDFLTAVTAVLLLNFASSADAGDDAAAAERLRTTLLEHYLNRKLSDQFHPTFSVEFPDCPQVRDGILSGSVVERTVWIDQQLHWEPSDYNDITAIDMNLDSVQHPTIKLAEEVRKKLLKKNADEMETVRVTYEGIVSWDHSVEVNRKCKSVWDKYSECELLFTMSDAGELAPNYDRLKSMHKDSAVDAEMCPGIDVKSSDSLSSEYSHNTVYKVVVRVPAS